MNWALLTAQPDPLSYFSLLVANDAQFPLLEAAACIAQDDDPKLDVQAVLDQVEALSQRLKRRLAQVTSSSSTATSRAQTATTPLQKLLILNRFFYQELGFAGADEGDREGEDGQGDADAFFIHAALRTRRASPTVLAVLWLELAQSMGLEASGVNFPRYLLIRVNLPHQKGPVLLNPLNGKAFLPSRLLTLWATLYQEVKAQHPAVAAAPLWEPPLNDAKPREIVTLLLLQLKRAHQANDNASGLMGACDRLILLLPHAWSEYRDRGQAHFKCGRFARAVADFDVYLAHSAGAPDHEVINVTRAQALARL